MRPAGGLQPCQHRLLRLRHHRRQHATRHAPPHHRRRSQDQPRALRQQRHPLAHPLRQVPRYRVYPALLHGLRIADQEERRAPGSSQHAVHQVAVAGRVHQQVLKQRRRVCRRQRPHRAPADQPRLRQVGQQQAQGVRRPDLRVTIGAHDARRRGQARQGVDQVQGVRPRPLQIIEHQQRAGRPRHVGQEARHRRVDQPPLLLRGQGDGGQRLQHPRQFGQQPHQPGAARQLAATPLRPL